MKSYKSYASLVAVAALTGVVAHAESRYSPFIRAEVTYTNTGYSKNFDPNKSVCAAPSGYAAGAGFTTGVLIEDMFNFSVSHEFSVSSGSTKWKGETATSPGPFFTHAEAQQIPVLLNYRYHYELDQAGKYTLFAGPTVGFIHETMTNVLRDPNGFTGLAGSESASKWKPAYGGTVGLTANLTDHWTVTASAQMLHVGSSEYVTHQGEFTTITGSANRPSFALSAGYSW